MTSTSSFATASAYSTEVEGDAPVLLRMRIKGVIGSDYLRFVMDRAQWLGIAGWVRGTQSGQVEIVAAGPEALVGALEMACVLGPLDTLVEALHTETTNEIVPDGFVLLAQK